MQNFGEEKTHTKKLKQKQDVHSNKVFSYFFGLRIGSVLNVTLELDSVMNRC